MMIHLRAVWFLFFYVFIFFLKNGEKIEELFYECNYLKNNFLLFLTIFKTTITLKIIFKKLIKKSEKYSMNVIIF